MLYITCQGLIDFCLLGFDSFNNLFRDGNGGGGTGNGGGFGGGGNQAAFSNG